MQQLPTSDDQSNNNYNNDKTSLMSHQQQPSSPNNSRNHQQHHYFTPDAGDGDEDDDDGVVIMSSNAVSSSVSSSTAFSHLYNQPSHINQQNAKLTKYSNIHHAHRKLPKRIRNAFIQPPSDEDDDERRRNGRPNFDDDDGDYSDVDEEELEEEEKFDEERKRRTKKRRSKLGDEEENEPTSTTVLENHHDEACEPHVEADGERDHVHDLSSVIPPDTITFFENVCPKLKFELSLNAIWNLTMISVFIFGVIFGLLFGDSCKEFYNTTLLINTEESSSSRSSTNRAEEKTQIASAVPKVEYETHIPAPEPHYDPSSSSSRDTEHPSISDCIWATVSSCLGWSYFLAWVISFLPQLYTNWTRKSVVGQSIAFAYTNLLGFSCYAVFNTALYTSTEIKKQYQERFHSKNDVEINDVWYAVFATICCTVNVYQCLVYERGGQKVAKMVLVFIFSSLLLLGAWLVLIFMFYNPPDDTNSNDNKRKENIYYLLNPLDFLYGVGIVKVLVTLFKYAPQVLLNYKRKKTVGVSISMWLLDFSGGMMSLTQELLDAGLRDAWVEVEGNWVKLSLSVISMSYDTIFILQHYVFYAKNNEKIISEYKRKMRAHRIRELAIHGGNAEGEIDGGREVIVVENAGGGSRKKRRSKNPQQLASCDEDVQIDESNNAMV